MPLSPEETQKLLQLLKLWFYHGSYATEFAGELLELFSLEDIKFEEE